MNPTNGKPPYSPVDALRAMIALIEGGEASPDLIYIAAQQRAGDQFNLFCEYGARNGEADPDELADMLERHVNEMINDDDI